LITQLTVERHSRQDVALLKAQRHRLAVRVLDEGTGQAAYYTVTRRAWLPQRRTAIHMLRLALGPPATTKP
jgi:hypothetical protein